MKGRLRHTALLFFLPSLFLYGSPLRVRIQARGASLPLPNACNPNDYGSTLQQLHYGLMMAAAYRCVGLSANDFLNYGCYCGSGNTGVNTRPADALDSECRKHDINLWAICENPLYNLPDGQPCNCYRQYVSLVCKNGELELPAGLNVCERACALDTYWLARGSRDVATAFQSAHEHHWAGFGPEFPIPDYCSSTEPAFPTTPFAPTEGLVLPAAQFWPVGKLQQNPEVPQAESDLAGKR